MARRLFNPDLEKLILKAALSSAKNAKMLARLKREHFATEIASEAFERVSHLMQTRGKTISWKALCFDAVLSDRTRAALREFKTRVPDNPDDVTELMRSITSYAAIRRVNEFGKALSQRMQDEEVDADALLNFVNENVAAIDAGTSTIKARHIGVGDNSLPLLKKILKGDFTRYIPTGFKGYDDMNRGIGLGSLLVVAAPSGNGKSVLVQTLSRNFALQGARVCVVPLEMDDASLLKREMAAQTQIELTRFIDPVKSLSRKERDGVVDAYRSLSRRIKKTGGKLTILSATEDLGIENILAYCKAHNYTAVVIDYVGLLAGTDGDDQAKALSRIARTAKLWATANSAVVVLAAQLSDDGVVRYSRALREHASNLWQWMFDGRARELGLITVHQTKARMENDAPFTIRFDPPTMTMRDPTEAEKKAAKAHATGEEQGGNRGKGKPQGKPAGKGDKKQPKARPIEDYLEAF